MEAALNVPVAADALQEFVAARRIRLEAANVDDALDAGFPLFLPRNTVVSRVISTTGAGFESQFAHPELLGPTVGGVVILAVAAAALGFT